jgi:type IV pilus assembly protein PilQ
VLDPRSNQIFITDIPSKLEEIRKLIEKTDIAQKQVMIEARIVEADDKFSRNLGAKLGFFGDGWKNAAVGSSYGNLSGTSSTPGTAVNLPANLIGTNPAGTLGVSLFNSAATRFLNLELSALEADNKGKIISSPRVVTGDKVKALIEQGTEIPYLTASSSGATTIQYRKAVLKLEVTPQITPDGNVILTVDVSKDSPSLDIQLTYGVAIDTKHVQTEVLVENGGTVVLGGIFQMEQRDKVSQIPFLGDIPILGNAFKNTERTNNKTELLIFLTPKVMSGRQPK